MPRGRRINGKWVPDEERLKGTKVRDAKRKLSERINELCAEDGVEPGDNLSDADVRKFLTLTHAEKHMINLIARGYPVRNANAILRAVEMKMDRSAPRPPPAAAEQQGVTVTINTITDPSATVSTTTGKVAPARPLKGQEPSC